MPVRTLFSWLMIVTMATITAVKAEWATVALMNAVDSFRTCLLLGESRVTESVV